MSCTTSRTAKADSLVTQSTNPQTSAATHDQQNTPAASHPAVTATISHQESTSAYTESSILEDLLELTSDEEFMMSLSSGNSAPVSSHQMTQPSSTQITTPTPLAPLQQKAPVLDLLPAPVLDSLLQFPTPAMQPPQLPHTSDAANTASHTSDAANTASHTSDSQ